MKNELVEKLLIYAESHLYLNKEDEVYFRNVLLHKFNELEPYEGKIEDKEFIEGLETPTYLVNEIEKEFENIDTASIEEIFGLLSPLPSEVIKKFNEYKNESPEKACEYFYNLCIRNNYVKLDNIRKNKMWTHEAQNNYLEITINLSKPEKNNKDIAKLVNQVSTSYPKCLLCRENEGYFGINGKMERSNIRLVPLKLNNEDWFLQYSPYGYYSEHAIVLNKEHTPMNVTDKTAKRLLDFCDLFPNYFIGSNSDRPIVGGSILNHEHYQAGNHLMPMMFSRDKYELKSDKYKDVKISYLDWYNSTIMLKSENKNEIVNAYADILLAWRYYTDEKAMIISNDEEGNHSTVTTITRKINNEYVIYLILRNNKTNEEYPEGIFHAHPEFHNIKKEGIGLIEAMGLFILPGRLVTELNLIEEILSNTTNPMRYYLENNECLNKHLDWINYLINKYGRRNKPEKAKELVKYEIVLVCEKILDNTAVFKNTIDGQLNLFKFFKECELEVIE